MTSKQLTESSLKEPSETKRENLVEWTKSRSISIELFFRLVVSCLLVSLNKISIKACACLLLCKHENFFRKSIKPWSNLKSRFETRTKNQNYRWRHYGKYILKLNFLCLNFAELLNKILINWTSSECRKKPGMNIANVGKNFCFTEIA